MRADIESKGDNQYIQFQETLVRNQFIRKVYTILSIQLFITFGFVLLSCNITVLSTWLREQRFIIMWISMIAMIALMFSTVLFEKYPGNIGILGAFTIIETLLISSFASMFNKNTVFMAVLYTAVIVGALTVVALTSKKEFSGLMPFLTVGVVILCLFGFTLIWLPFGILIYSAIAAVIFSIYIIIDTQMIVGGKGRASYTVDDYVFAALSM